MFQGDGTGRAICVPRGSTESTPLYVADDYSTVTALLTDFLHFIKYELFPMSQPGRLLLHSEAGSESRLAITERSAPLLIPHPNQGSAHSKPRTPERFVMVLLASPLFFGIKGAKLRSHFSNLLKFHKRRAQTGFFVP